MQAVLHSESHVNSLKVPLAGIDVHYLHVPGRGPAHVYVSAWPRDGIRAEVSVSSGYAFRKGSTVNQQHRLTLPLV